VLSVTHTVLINQPVEHVFSYLVDVRSHTEWQADILDASLMPPGPPQIGSEYHYTAESMGRTIRSAMRVEGLIPHRRWVLASTNDAVPMRTAFHFDEHAGATQLTISTSMERGYPLHAHNMVQAQLERALQEQAARIKEALERGAPPPTA